MAIAVSSRPTAAALATADVQAQLEAASRQPLSWPSFDNRRMAEARLASTSASRPPCSASAVVKNDRTSSGMNTSSGTHDVPEAAAGAGSVGRVVATAAKVGVVI